ncbi:HD domain-containing phosphohydrolase [uncultured Mailhella sp.]|uniref:HD-GYP domain-containing protein n=1 Tax=uncultured Mailhella sp. TaxID=1981031 RepID=UPI002633FE38|nr:HD domain-containing phosphohydrolase [uncultured Mailhella sp.]
MNSREGLSHFGFSKKSALLAGVCLALVSGGIALFFCLSQLESRRVEVMQRYEQNVEVWLTDAGQAVDIWNTDMKKLRQRVSESETYRLFSGDFFGLKQSAAENPGAAGEDSLSGTAAALSEETPVMRRILLEFMNYNGLLDARLVNREGQTILSAYSTPTPLTSAQSEAALNTMKTGKTTFLPVRGTSDGLVLDVFEPIYELEAPDKCVAVFMSSTPVLSRITQFIARPKQNDMATAAMLQKRGTAWERIQVPLPEVLPEDLQKALTESTGKLPFALRSSVFPNNGMVYSMSATLPVLGWTLVHETPAAVVDEMVFRAEVPVYVAAVLGWLSFMLLCGLLWWMAFGRQQMAVTSELRRLNQVVSRQKELLDSVNTSLDVGLFMADVKGQIRVCNPALAGILGRKEDEILDQTLFSCFPMEAATALLEQIRQVALNNKEGACEVRMERDGDQRLYRVTLFPFLDASETEVRNSIRGAVVTMKDITEFRRHSERMRRQQRSLITAFTQAEESVDPYLAGHSMRMSRLGELMAASMDLPEDGRNTVIMGAQLSQVGKLFIPREILTKEGKLTPEELQEVRRAPEHAFRLMESVDFDLPIARALHEMYENMDGSGYPRGLHGEDILPEARILAVLNAFCAMVSSRSYHKGKDERTALAELENNPRFDQTVVEHLEKVLSTPEGILAARS